MAAISPAPDPPTDDVAEFAGFRLDRRCGGVFRLDAVGTLTPVEIGSRALDLLWVLARRPGTVIPKREIMDSVWPDTVVEEKNLSMQVSALRKVLEREGGRAEWVQAVPGRGYRFVAPGPSTDTVPASVQEPAANTARRPAMTRALFVVPATLLASLLAIAPVAVWFNQRPAMPAAYSPQDRRLSLIVLPFENGSGDPGEDSVAADITRDVTDLWAQDPAVPTVPAATAGAYQGKMPNLRVIGREHDVHFALMGHARRQEGHVIVTATLYETIHARQLWSQRVDQPDTSDALRRVAHSIQGSAFQAMINEEVARATREHPGSQDKRDLMLASEATSLMQDTEANLHARLTLIDRAIALDPNYVWALREKARRHANLVTNGFSSDRERDLEVATEMLNRALVLAPDDFYVLREKAVVLRAQSNWTQAAAINRRLIERQPLSAYRHLELGANLMNLGLHKQALEQFRIAKLSAVSSDAVNYIDAALSIALVATGSYEEAIEQARFAIQEFTPENGRSGEIPWLALIAAESANCQDADAQADLQKFLSRPRTWMTIKLVQQNPSFSANPNLLDGLRRAGLVEE